MVSETLKLKEFFFPDLDLKVLMPENWAVQSRLADAEGALMNAVWISPKETIVLMNASITVYHAGGSSQKVYFERHFALYENEPDTAILGSGETAEFGIPLHTIRVKMRKAGMEMGGIIAFHCTEKFSYIIQFIAPAEHFDDTKPLWSAILGSLSIVEFDIPEMPNKPEAGAQEANGGWIVNVPPMTVNNEIIPSAAFFHDEYGFGIQVPSDSVWAKVGPEEKWAILFQLPYKVAEFSATIVVQVLGGGEITSSQLMDGVENQLLRERDGVRKTRSTFSAGYGALEYMHAIYSHTGTVVNSYAFAHARRDRSFVFEVLIPEGAHGNPEALAYTIANGFTVFKPKIRTQGA